MRTSMWREPGRISVFLRLPDEEKRKPMMSRGKWVPSGRFLQEDLGSVGFGGEELYFGPRRFSGQRKLPGKEELLDGPVVE